MMIKDHTASTDKLKKAAGQANPPLTPSATMNAEQTANLEALRTASGTGFDALYKEQQTAAHRQALTALQHRLLAVQDGAAEAATLDQVLERLGNLMAEPQNPATADADADAKAYVHGEMAINEQASTFDLFMAMTKWGSLGVAVLLVFLVMWFHPGGSFIAGLIGAGVLAVVGGFALKSKPQSH